jgi:hypothetical protein
MTIPTTRKYGLVPDHKGAEAFRKAGWPAETATTADELRAKVKAASQEAQAKFRISQVDYRMLRRMGA